MPQDTIELERVRQEQQYRRDHLTDDERANIEAVSHRIKGWGGRLQDAIDAGLVLQSSSYGYQDTCEFVDWLKAKRPLQTIPESHDALEAMADSYPGVDFGFKDVDDVEPDRIRYAMVQEQQRAKLEEASKA